MVSALENKISISVHNPGAKKVFFLLSGILRSVPLTLFVSTFNDSLRISTYICGT
jgi:hypothetical protein